jgi:methyl-accepting chemotaxis protein
MLDLSTDGALLAKIAGINAERGSRTILTIPDVGAVPGRLAGTSDLGIHLAFQVSGKTKEALDAYLQRLINAEMTFVSVAQDAAAKLGAALTQAVASKRIKEDDLFSSALEPVEGSEPEQYIAPFTALTDELFPSIQEPALNMDARIQFCAAVTTMCVRARRNSAE